MVEAKNMATKLNIPYICMDRNPETSFMRLYKLLPLALRTNMLINSLLMKTRGEDPISKMLEHRPPYTDLLKHNAKTKGMLYADSPAMQLTMMFERELVFVHHLKKIKENRILGIIGMSHLWALDKCWEEDIHFEELASPEGLGIDKSIALFSKIFENADDDDDDD